MSAASKLVIGGASGFWGEAPHATAQLIATNQLDYLVYDYLAEVTMSIMARARAKDPTLGYATDFVTGALAPNLEEIARQKIRVISNAGGVNPIACAEAIESAIADKGLNLKVATVIGDDLIAAKEKFAKDGIAEMFTGEPFPEIEKIASINAYLGAFPIVRALEAGADIVITGRCVDSAVTLAACVHRFGWAPDQYDLLAAGALAGHIIECGPQATGGNFTDWRQAGNIAEIGYPVVEVEPDGAFTVTKPNDTTGIVSRLSVGEQMLYEIGDPQTYRLPDVICDFSRVRLEEVSENRVRLTGAIGRSPSPEYKVSLTYADGYRAGMLLNFQGLEVREKAKAFAEAVFGRSRARLRTANAPDYRTTDIELLGGTTNHDDYQEVAVKLAAHHDRPEAIGIFLKELTGLALATPAGMSMFAGGGRPKPSPVVRLFSFLVNKDQVPVNIQIGGETHSVETPLAQGSSIAVPAIEPPETSNGQEPMVEVPLVAVAVGRSGDKGNNANIGLMARHPEYLPWIWQQVDEAFVTARFSDFLQGPAERFYLPGSHAINYLLHEVLGGGGMASLRLDAQGKAYAQMLLAEKIEIPQSLYDSMRKSDEAR